MVSVLHGSFFPSFRSPIAEQISLEREIRSQIPVLKGQEKRDDIKIKIQKPIAVKDEASKSPTLLTRPTFYLLFIRPSLEPLRRNKFPVGLSLSTESHDRFL